MKNKITKKITIEEFSLLTSKYVSKEIKKEIIRKAEVIKKVSDGISDKH